MHLILSSRAQLQCFAWEQFSKWSVLYFSTLGFIDTLSASPGLITTITIASISVVVLIFVAMIRSESIRAKLSNLSLQCLLWRDQLTASSTVEVESLAQSDHLSREIHA